jgi:hypothetical protein
VNAPRAESPTGLVKPHCFDPGNPRQIQSISALLVLDPGVGVDRPDLVCGQVSLARGHNRLAGMGKENMLWI